MSRSAKQILITIIFLAILALAGKLIYSWLKPAPTCFDNKQNQNEEGVDCGGRCEKICEKLFETQDIQIIESTFILGGQGRYDLMARVKNPNNQIGASKFTYTFTLKGKGGKVLAEIKKSSFILPVETKYLIETDIEVKEVPDMVDVLITETEWEEFFGYERPDLNIYNKRYNLISSGVGYSEAFGLLRNESAFDFETVKINIILRDDEGRPLAFNKTIMNTVNSGEERDFRIFWPVNFPGQVQNTEMEAEADVFNSENYIKKYTKSERMDFQKNK